MAAQRMDSPASTAANPSCIMYLPTLYNTTDVSLLKMTVRVEESVPIQLKYIITESGSSESIIIISHLITQLCSTHDHRP